VKIATAQTLISPDIAANGAEIRSAIAMAAVAGGAVVHFCEGALSGYAKAQIKTPGGWADFDWAAQQTELRAIAELCGRCHIFAVVGGAHRLSEANPPHNSLYVFSDTGALVTRYDKRYLSNSELGGWYTPGSEPITFEVDGMRFGCAICIEAQFPEIFGTYERLGVDAVLFSSYGIPSFFQIALRAHAGLNCFWIGAATPAQKAPMGPAGIIGPDGEWTARCSELPESEVTVATLDRHDPRYDIPLKKARPWRAKARHGEIYREKIVNHPRSGNRSEY
jgi:predicted amidohydrolase